MACVLHWSPAIQSPFRRIHLRSTRPDRGSWVVQGWVVTDPEALAALDLPDGETAVEIPDRMIPFFTQ